MQKIKISEIKPDPLQPRQEFDPSDLELLKRSIASQGIITPLTVEITDTGFLLVDGERRLRAAIQLGMKDVPCEVLAPMNDLERLVKRFHIQEQHRNWSYFDKARAIQMMVINGGLKENEVAEILGIPSRQISNLLALLTMSKRSQVLAASKRITYSMLVRVNTLLNNLKDQSLRPKLEESILNRLEDGRLTKKPQVDDFARSISVAGDKIAKKIINKKNYTPEEALLDSNADDLKYADKLMAGMNWTWGALNAAVNHKAYRVLDDGQIRVLRSVHKRLTELLSLYK